MPLTLITPAIKDQVLNFLVEKVPLEEYVNIKSKIIITALSIDFVTLNAILRQFERAGLLEDLGVGMDTISLILLAESHDLAQKGGFYIQEEVFKGNIEKLGYEIDNLRKQLSPDHLETVNKISSIANAIFTGLSLLPK